MRAGIPSYDWHDFDRQVKTAISRQSQSDATRLTNTKHLKRLFEKHLVFGGEYGYWRAEDGPCLEPSFEDWVAWLSKLDEEVDDYLEYLDYQEENDRH